MKPKFLIPLIAFLALLLYLFLWPVPIDPVSWTPSSSRGFQGDLAPNTLLQQTERLELNEGEGPEDVAIDSGGRIYVSLQNGSIVRMDSTGKNQELFAQTKGRPLGLQFDREGNLIVADSYRGLLRISPGGEIRVLTAEEGGVPFRFTNALDIAGDGTIYFTDSSHRFHQREYQEDALEHRPNGRLLAYDPSTGKTTLLLDRLIYPNGVALSKGEDYLLFNETWEYRIVRYWLKGPRKGEKEIFLEGLPAFPDGITRGSDDTFWVALVSPRNPVVEKLAPYPALRRMVKRLPRFLLPDAIPYAAVLGINSRGEIRYNLQDPAGTKIHAISTVREREGYLYFGSLKDQALGRLPRPGESSRP